MSRFAGNAVDAILRPLILRACDIDPESGSPRSREDFNILCTDLDSQIRNLKEDLFRHGSVDLSLRPNVSGHLVLNGLTEDTDFQGMGMKLGEIRDRIVVETFGNNEEFLETVRGANLRLGRPMPIYVLLTGGSCSLPVIQNLAIGDMSVDRAIFRFVRVESLPSWIERLPRELAELVGTAYLQCAVAIGGSAPELPVEIDDLAAAVTPPPAGKRTLERYQVTGVG